MAVVTNQVAQPANSNAQAIKFKLVLKMAPGASQQIAQKQAKLVQAAMKAWNLSTVWLTTMVRAATTAITVRTTTTLDTVTID